MANRVTRVDTQSLILPTDAHARVTRSDTQVLLAPSDARARVTRVDTQVLIPTIAAATSTLDNLATDQAYTPPPGFTPWAAAVANLNWYQFTKTDLTYGETIDVSPAMIPGDVTGRTFITGIGSGPQQTNTYFATDPSQQGAATTGAYPYKTFPLGVSNPLSAPTATASTTSASGTPYEYAQAASVNNALIGAGGTGYVQGDVLTVVGGALVVGLPAAQVKVTAVDPNGAVTNLTLYGGGFYSLGAGPPASTTTTGGTGAGCTLQGLTVIAIGTTGLTLPSYSNGAGYYYQWNTTASTLQAEVGQGDLLGGYNTTPLSLKTAQTVNFSIDAYGDQAVQPVPPDILMWLFGTPSGSSLTGAAVSLSFSTGQFTLWSAVHGTNGGNLAGTTIAATPFTPSPKTWYRISATCTAQTASVSPGFSVKITVALQASPTVVLATLSGFVAYGGESMGMGINRTTNTNDVYSAEFNNYYLRVQQPVSGVTNETTSYVYTYQTEYGTAPNAIDQESGPSPPSANVVLTYNGTVTPATLDPVTVVIPPAPADEEITGLNLYRLVFGTNGSETYEFVATLAPNTVNNTTYIDTTVDANLGAALTTTGYSPPPPNLQGILALPNGVMAGFFDNVLCLSAPDFPFAWPIANQYTTDTPIVGIAAIDTTVLILTTAHPYTAYGSDPSAYTMSKETSIQGCVSKASIATHKRAGVIYAGANGLCYYRGQGNLDLLRDQEDKPIFSYEEWVALDPASILGVVHDDYYWFWSDSTAQPDKSYFLDIPSFFGFGGGRIVGGFGLAETDVHVTCAYVDPTADALYLTPDKSTFPVNGAVVTVPLNVLSQWEGNTAALRPYAWARQEMLMISDTTFQLAKLDAENYTSITLTISNENGTVFSGAVTSQVPFVVAALAGRRFTIEITGTSSVNTLTLVENAAEFWQASR